MVYCLLVGLMLRRAGSGDTVLGNMGFSLLAVVVCRFSYDWLCRAIPTYPSRYSRQVPAETLACSAFRALPVSSAHGGKHAGLT